VSVSKTVSRTAARFESVIHAEAISSADVTASTALRLLCNHARQYIGDGEDADMIRLWKRSSLSSSVGKFSLNRATIGHGAQKTDLNRVARGAHIHNIYAHITQITQITQINRINTI